MADATFDTLTYAKKLREAGFTERQAEAQAEALHAVASKNLATKKDLKELEIRLRHDLTLRLGGITVAGVIVLGVLMQL